MLVLQGALEPSLRLRLVAELKVVQSECARVIRIARIQAGRLLSPRERRSGVTRSCMSGSTPRDFLLLS
jgi:hypothetical protein